MKGAAAERKAEGWSVTMSRSLMEPFLTFSTRRDLRERAFKAWVGRGGESGPKDNNPIAEKIAHLRLEQAHLHGYDSYSKYALQDTMAKTPEAVKDLLMKVWTPAVRRAGEEAADLEKIAGHKIEPWDWRFYAEKVRAEKYDLDDAEIKPYFQLERVAEAAFYCAGKLFGVNFVQKEDVSGYHSDVKVYEVRNKSDGAQVGVFLHDNYARSTKRGGAWMSHLREQSDGTIPIICNNNNFAKAEEGGATLISLDDARTLFHELGHGLHGLLSNVRFASLGGTNVLRDFVELPSQLFEHWLLEPEVLRRFARHYKTDEPIPDALVAKLNAAATFNAGFDSVEYCACALVDLELHNRTSMDGLKLDEFEAETLEKLGMPSTIVMRHRLPHFLHLFADDGYASAYYVYRWAAVLDEDAFTAFKEAGDCFDGETAARLRECIYSVGNTREPMEAYRAFRGRDATVEPMLKAYGLVSA